MQDLISVIVPVYNVQDYLPQCLDSILGQDYETLEVILVDDGSKDASGDICDRYAKMDSRVRVIHQKNGGGGAAKNAGLRIATGEYLSFVDSDDYLEPGAYSHMLTLMKEKQADVVRCSFRNVFRTHSVDNEYEPGCTVVTGMEFLIRFTTDWTCGLLWNKLYKRSLFNGVFFPEGHKIDDEYFTYQGIMNARKVVCDDRVIYNYRKRASGIMLSPQSAEKLALERIDFMETRRQRVIARFPQLRRDFDVAYVDALTYLPDYPDNTAVSIRNLRKRSLAYFLERGNTFPPRYLLRGIVRLHLSPVRTLLKKAQKNRPAVDRQDYFA